jgi:hypothetical protein
MGRERRDFVRRSGLRDATLIVIASEGVVTEPSYFNGLKARWRSPRIQVEVLARINAGESSPERVLEALRAFARSYKLRDGDQLWLVIDRDSWKLRSIASVARECERLRYKLAVSNPCFELWLLLHFEDVPNRTAERRQELFENESSLLKRETAAHRQPNTEFIDHFISGTAAAIARSRCLDVTPGARWPNQLATRVYRLVEQLQPQDA